MPNTPVPASGEAVPKNQTHDEVVADAMRELEGQVADLRLMAQIASELACRTIARPLATLEGFLVFHLNVDERDTVLFAIENVASRADALKASYIAAFHGETLQ